MINMRSFICVSTAKYTTFGYIALHIPANFQPKKVAPTGALYLLQHQPFLQPDLSIPGCLFIEAMTCLVPLHLFWFFRSPEEFFRTFLRYMRIIRSELKENGSRRKVRGMSNRINLGHLTDKRLSSLTLQFRTIQVPVREARRCCHHDIMCGPLIQAASQYAIHPTEVMTDISKTFGVHIWLR